MSKENTLIFAFNRGIISPLALARIDLEKRVALSAEQQSNWMPRNLGSMMLRPGLEYVLEAGYGEQPIYIPFVFSVDDTAIIEVLDRKLQFYVDEEIVNGATQAFTVTNSDFATNLTGWTDEDEAGATSTWVSANRMGLTGTGTNAAIRSQLITTTTGILHTICVDVARGPVLLRLGSTSGADDVLNEVRLGTGRHYLSFTPASNFYIWIANRENRQSLVSLIAGNLFVSGMSAPWFGFSSGGEPSTEFYDLDKLRWDQSGDIVYVACDDYQPRKIERRGDNSWSLTLYEPEDGPFRPINSTPTTITPSNTLGDIALTASQPLFRSGHVGALFRLTSTGQRVTDSFSSANDFSNSVRVTGVGADRLIGIGISNTFVATLTLQRSIGEEGDWTDVTTYTTTQGTSYQDNLDNQIVYYRIGVKAGNYTSGTANITLSRSTGSLTGVCRITGVTNSTSASAVVLSDLGGLDATSDWEEGEWSDYRGWPTAVALYEGRLWWAGRDKIWGSVSDDFESFDDAVEGDSGPITRSIGSGPVDTINWLLPLQRLLVGGQGAEYSARSSTFDEPLTPTNFNLKVPSTQGSATVPAARLDTRGVFVHRCGTKLYLMEFDSGALDYYSLDLTALCPEVCRAGIVRIAVQRQPDTRIHCVLSDGTVAVCLFDPLEDVKCWVTVQTDGEVRDAFVLPGDEEDKVYYLVKREINGTDQFYLERWAKESECVGGTVNRQADSCLVLEDVFTDTLTVSHLEGEDVVVWADGAYLGEFTVSGGTVALGQTVTSAVVGLPYTARYKSTKIAKGSNLGTPLTQKGRIDHIGLVMANTHASGLRYGPDFDNLDNLPGYEDGAPVDPDYVWEHYDKDMIEFPGHWTTDNRVCLEASAPKPATVLACVVGILKNDKA